MVNVDSKHQQTAVEIAQALMELPEEARREMLAFGAGMEAALRLKQKEENENGHS